MERAVASSSSMGSSRRSAAVATASAALAASSGAAGVDTRKRKRGALQDISNTSKKIAEATARGIVKKERGSSARASTRASAKPPTAAPGPAQAQAARAPLRSAGSRINSARGGGNAVVKKEKTDALPKKRKHEASAENLQAPAPHQKVQSLLTFQTTSRSTRARSSAAVATRSSDAGAQTELSMSQELRLVKRENKENEVPEDEPMPELKQEAVAAFSWAPRPHKFTFDHTNSGFDARTYAAAVSDIDALPDAQKAAHCVTLVREIDTYHRLHEDKYFPEPDYIGSLQTDINEKMRTILIDWLVEVGEEYELDSQTFHKAVNLVDRCLKKFKINRKQFQLLGCACMMVAAKFEEVYGPNVEEFVYISDQTYTAEEMLEMEAKVLQALEYRVASTTCYGFVTRYTQAGCTSEKQKSLVMYLCDYAQLYYRMLKFRPSVVVASAVYLARLMTGEREAWTPTLHHVTKYNPWELRACVLELLRLHRVEADVVASQRDKAKAVSEKYLVDKFHAASAIPPVEEAAADRSFLEYERPAATS